MTTNNKKVGVVLVGGPAMRMAFGGFPGKDSVSCTAGTSATLSMSEEKTPEEIDFSVLENLEYHSSPNLGQKVDIRGLEPAVGINDGPTTWHSLGHFAVLSNGGFTEPASKGLLKDALAWINELEKTILQTTSDDSSVWNQLGIDRENFDQFIHELREHAVILASIYMTTSSPLDNPIFSSCAQELLVEIPHLQATNILQRYCTMEELQHWSNDLQPMKITLSIGCIQKEIAPYNFSRELSAALMAVVIFHFFDQDKMPIVSERQFMRWSRVVSSIFIFELQQEFKLAIKQGNDGRHRLILAAMVS